MAKRLTNKEVQDRLDNKFNGKYELVSDYINRNSNITLKCRVHKIEWNVIGECAIRDDRILTICPGCKKEKDKEIEDYLYADLVCDYCQKKFKRLKSNLHKSKHGIFFCCRKCKDSAQSLSNGKHIIQPAHYGTGNGIHRYRDMAYKEYEHKCAVCDWEEDTRILEVHHIDFDRTNNLINNLIILCPNCHRKITLKYYKLIISKTRKIVKLKECGDIA